MLVNDSKPRHIAVAPVRDRVIHRLLYDYFVPLLDPYFDYDVWSCRKDKGLDAAINRTQKLLSRYPHSWVWRGDITKFFDSVNQTVLTGVVNYYIKDHVAIELLDEVINSYKVAPDQGIPIGNLTSQILANVYLNEFDRHVRHILKPSAYVRYGDDFILLFPTQHEVKQARTAAISFLDSTLHLTMHARNDIIVPVRKGIHFLGLGLYPAGHHIMSPTWSRLQKRLDSINQPSYFGFVNSMGSARQQKQFPWL